MASSMDWATTPAITPPPGQTSNFVDPPSIGYRFMLANIIGGVIFLGFGALRLFTRAFIVRSLGSDDCVCISAMAIYCAALALFQLAIYYGLGTHLWDVPLAHYSPHFLLLWTIAAILYFVIMFLIKLSILMMYRRVFVSRSFIIRWWLVTCFTAAYTVVSIIMCICPCRPVEAAWHLSVPPSYCINVPGFYVANAVLNSLSDLFILLLPMRVVWALSIKTRQRIILTCLFSIGSVSCVVSIVRVKSIISWMLAGDDDSTYTLVDVAVWTQVELTVGMVCACVPALKPLGDKFCGELWSSNNASLPSPPSYGNNEGGRNATDPGEGSYRLHVYGNQTRVQSVNESKGARVTSRKAESDTESTHYIIQDDE